MTKYGWLAPLLLAGSLCASEAATSRPLNILFIAVDDLRPDFSCAGVAGMVTPHIDRLAASGTVFRNAYCQQAVCGPSRASVMTGCRPDTTRVYDLETHFRTTMPTVVTVGQFFRQHGWHTEAVGKIYHGRQEDPLAWSVPWKMNAETGVPGATYRDPAIAEAHSAAVAAWQASDRVGHPPYGPAWERADVPDDAYSDGSNAAYAADRLVELGTAGKPFFFAVGFRKPHLPFVAPKRYWDLYDAAAMPLTRDGVLPQGAPAWAGHNSAELREYAGIPPSGPLDVATARSLMHGYRACVSYVDRNIGRLLDVLDRTGLAATTVVVVWGDHGWHLGDHGLWCKHTNFEAATRSALLMRLPGQAAPGRACDALVELVDIYPTLAAVAGLPPPEHLEGTSFAPLLDDPGRAWKSAVFSQYPRASENTFGQGPLMGRSLRTATGRYTEWQRPDGSVAARELYDLATDPDETRNLADEADMAPMVVDLAERLANGWRAARPAP